MFDGSTPTPTDAAAPPAAGAETEVAAAAVTDRGPVRVVSPDSASIPPFHAHPVGAAHPRRRLGRGLVLGAG